MQKFIFGFSFLLLLATATLFVGRTQEKARNYGEWLQRYRDADAFYQKATALSFSENYGPKEEALESEWNRQALQGFEKLYKELPTSLPVYDSLRFHTSFRTGELHHYFENFSGAIDYYKNAIAVKQRSNLPDSLLFKPLLYSGIIYYNQNKYDTAAQFFKQAEKIQLVYGNRLTEIERLYNILGVLYHEQGNYRQAQNYVRKALTLLTPTNPFYDELFVNYNINLAQLHLRLEEYDKANAIYQQLLPRNINLNEINHNIGYINLSLGAPDKAIEYFRRVNYTNNKMVRLYNSIGQAFFNLKKFDSASYYYEKAIATFQSLGANADPIGLGLVLKNKGDLKMQSGKPQDALTAYQEAIEQFYPSYKSTNIYDNPKEFSGVFSYINLFNTLQVKAEAWELLYRQNKEIATAKEILDVYQSAFALIGYVERTYTSDEARLFLTKIKYAVHAKPIDIAFELYQLTKDEAYLEQLYLFDQQNKAAVLALNRQQNQGNEGDKLSGSQESKLKAAITRLSIRAAQVTDSGQLASINAQIRDQEIALGKLLEQSSPDRIRNALNIPTIKFLQNDLLDRHTAIVSYHLSEKKLTTFTIKKEKLECTQKELPIDFEEQTTRLINQLKTPGQLPDTALINRISKLLLSNIYLNDLQQVIFIPDDILHSLPLECLRIDGQYLVQTRAVQYQFSTALLQKNKADFSDAEILSFAPFATHSAGADFPSLPSSVEEIENLKGKTLIGKDATKSSFLQLSGKFPVMHLATHAIANNDAEGLSYVAFAPAENKDDYLLYTQEIYGLLLDKTDLVILSACETNAGRLVKGEGVLSLSRAFAYAGCPNIITSFWKADDVSTAYITRRVHRYLAEGEGIAQAVRQAKLDYLNDKNINPRFKQPYYWSHLVFVGNYQPQSTFPWLWIIIISAAIGIVGFTLWKKPGKARRQVS